MIETNFNYSKPLIPFVIENVKSIIVHHTGTSTATPQQIHEWHLANGWSGFGYNEYIRKDGTVFIGRGNHIGAQCAGKNSSSYGICLEGNFEVEIPTEEQYKALGQRIYELKKVYPIGEIVPHKRYSQTECCGKNCSVGRIMQEYDQIMKMNLPHWAEKSIEFLKGVGIQINEKRFDDNMTRGELFAILERVYKNIKGV